jgi:hypothetical protein
MSALAMEPLAGLAPVALADLVEEAALLARVDRKYVVPVAALDELLTALPQGTRVLEIGGRRRFGYRSTYLDTPDLASFHSSGRSQRTRWKVRTRDYLDTGGRWLEVKTRGARGATVKQRVPLGGDGLIGDAAALVDTAVGDGTARTLWPVLTTSYGRTTVLLPGASARVTIDIDLTWTSPAGDSLRPRGLAIVETKTGSTPSAVDRLLWARGFRPVRLSKYGAGLAALDPTLPRRKWHDALARHLHLPTTSDHRSTR